jgi:hypothetical protein
LATLSLQCPPRELNRGGIDVAAKTLRPGANGAKQHAASDAGIQAGLGIDLHDRLSHQLRDRLWREELAEAVPPLTRVDPLELCLGSRGWQEHTFDLMAPLGQNATSPIVLS